MDLTDQQWEVLAPLIPDPQRRSDGRGRPWRDPRDVLNGILWILRMERGGLDLSECFVDGTFVGAKKGGGSVGKTLGGAKARSSWRWQTALLFLSPYAQQALVRTRSRS